MLGQSDGVVLHDLKLHWLEINMKSASPRLRVAACRAAGALATSVNSPIASLRSLP